MCFWHPGPHAGPLLPHAFLWGIRARLSLSPIRGQPTTSPFFPKIKTSTFNAYNISCQEKSNLIKVIQVVLKTENPQTLVEVFIFFEKGYVVNWDGSLNWLYCRYFSLFLSLLEKGCKLIWITYGNVFWLACVCMCTCASVHRCL